MASSPRTQPRPPATRRRAERRPRRVSRAFAGDRPYVFALVALLIVLGAMTVGPLQAFTAAADRVDSLEASRDALQGEVEALEERREQLTDPEEVEILARSELGLVKPGEVPFVVVTPEADPQLSRPTPAEPVEADAAWHRRLGRALTDWLR